MREPNLKSLKVFNAVAKHLNFRLAAEELHVTRGAVAQQIRQLETDLGVKLFNRLPRGLSLTEQAKPYYSAISHALQMINKATQSISVTSNRVKIGMTPTMAAKWLMPRLSEFEALHPDISLQVVTSDDLSDFISEEMDVAIRYGNVENEKTLASEHLVDVNLQAVCSPAYAKQHCAEHATDDTHSEFRVNNPDTFYIHRLIQDSHRYWDAWLKEMKLQRAQHTLAFNQSSLAIDAAVSGQGITLVASILVRNHLDKGDLVSLWDYSVADKQGYYLAYQKEGCTQKAADLAVCRWLREALIDSQ